MAQSVNIELVENLKPFIANVVQQQLGISPITHPGATVGSSNPVGALTVDVPTQVFTFNMPAGADHPAVTVDQGNSDPANAIQVDELTQVLTFNRPSTSDATEEGNTGKLLETDINGMVSVHYLGLHTSALVGVELSIGSDTFQKGTVSFVNNGEIVAALGILEIESLESQSGAGPAVPSIYLKAAGQDRIGIESSGLSFGFQSGNSWNYTIEAAGDFTFRAGAFGGTGTRVSFDSIVEIGGNDLLITTPNYATADLTISAKQDLLLSPDRNIVATPLGNITLSPQGDLNLSSAIGLVKVPVLTVANRIDFTDAYPKIIAPDRLLMDITRLEFQENTEIWVDDGDLVINPNYSLFLQGNALYIENDIEFAGGVARSVIFDTSGTIATLNGDLTLHPTGGGIILSSLVNGISMYGAVRSGGSLSFVDGPSHTIAFAGDGIITTGTGNLTIDGIAWPPSGSSHDPVTAGAYISLNVQEVSVVATTNSESEPSKVVATDASGLTRISGLGVGAAAIVNRVMIGGSPGFIGFSNAGMISNVSGDITIQPASHLILKPTSDIVYIEGNLEFDGSVARSIIFDAQGTISTLAGDLILTPFGGTLQVNANINFPAAKSITTTVGDITFAPTNNVAFHPVNEQIYFKGQVKFESATKIETLVGNMELAAAGNLIINPFVAFLIKEKSTPATPPAGYAALWFDTAGDLYYKNDAGTARKVSYT